jgi:hypothetical protein
MKKDSSLANISARNKKELVLTKPLILQALPEERELALAALLIKKSTEKKPVEEKEDSDEKPREIEEFTEPLPIMKSVLPNIEVIASARDIKKVFYSVLNMFDTLYFTVMKNTNICSKKVEVERSCLLECQHYGYCKVRDTIRELVKQI